jgi:hypothetical protein
MTAEELMVDSGQLTAREAASGRFRFAVGFSAAQRAYVAERLAIHRRARFDALQRITEGVELGEELPALQGEAGVVDLMWLETFWMEEGKVAACKAALASGMPPGLMATHGGMESIEVAETVTGIRKKRWALREAGWNGVVERLRVVVREGSLKGEV